MAHGERQIADLLAALPPEPGEWAAAAKEMPRARRALDEIEGVVLGHARQPHHDLEAALATAGYEPTPALVRAVRATMSL